MSKRTSVFIAEETPEETGSSYPDAFKPVCKDRYVRRLGTPGGMTNFGINIVRLAPGGMSSCRHAHSLQDEFVYVLDGEMILETDDGRTTVRPGMCVGFPAGTGDAHRFVNETDISASFLVVGDRSAGDVVTYPDDDLHGALDADGRLQFTRKDGTAY